MGMSHQRSRSRAWVQYFDLYRFLVMMGAFLLATLFAGLTLSAPFGGRPYGYHNSTRLPPLRFTPNGTFQISIFEDLHFGENAWVCNSLITSRNVC
jgi:hypothetical protein